MTAEDAGRLCLLKDSSAWLAYATMVPKALGAHGVITSPGPKSFPCLVGAIVGADGRIATCYVYVDSAVALLKASGDIKEAKFAPPAANNAETERRFKAEVEKQFKAVRDRLTQQDEFNRVQMAQDKTIIDLMVDTCIVKEPEYEKRLAANLAMADRIHAERNEAAKLETEPPTE